MAVERISITVDKEIAAKLQKLRELGIHINSSAAASKAINDMSDKLLKALEE